MRSTKTEALLVEVREAVASARKAGVTEMACIWDATVAAVDKGAHGVPSPEARRLADSIRRGMEPPTTAAAAPPISSTPATRGGPMPIKAPEFDASDKKTGMTLDELASFVESARAANAPGNAVIEVTTVGLTRPRIKTAKVRATSAK